MLNWSRLKISSTKSTFSPNDLRDQGCCLMSTDAWWWSDRASKAQSALSNKLWLSSQALAKEQVLTRISLRPVALATDQSQALSELSRGSRRIRGLSVDMFRWDNRLEISLQLQESKLKSTNMQIQSKQFPVESCQKKNEKFLMI